MNNQLVKACDCCDKKFSHIGIPHLPLGKLKHLSASLINAIKKSNIKGSLSLVFVDELIIGIDYEYASDQELALSEEICQTIYETSKDFFEILVESNEVEYYEIFLS